MILQHLLKLFTNKINNTPKQKVKKAIRSIFILIVLIFTSGFSFYLAEKTTNSDITVSDGIWWSIVTMTTVGYGDLYPTTFVGRYFIALPTFIIGIAFLSYVLGVIADYICSYRIKQQKGTIKCKDMEHIVIINNPNTQRVLGIIKQIQAYEQQVEQVCIIDNTNSELPSEFEELKFVKWLKGDPTQDDVLQRANLKEARNIIVLSKNPYDTDSDYHTLACVKRAICYNKNITVECINGQNKIFFTELNLSVIQRGGISDKMLIQETYNESIGLACKVPRGKPRGVLPD